MAKPTSVPALRSVLIVKADRLYAELLRRAVRDVSPRAEVMLVQDVASARAAVARTDFELVLAGFDRGLGGDVLQLIAELSTGANAHRHVFAIGSHLEYRILSVLHSLPILGLFDAGEESPSDFYLALRTVIAGQHYWSRSVLERLRREHATARAGCLNLSATEQLVLSVLGDGSDDATAAEALGLSPATVSTFRRKLHRKLSVQHRGELIRMAAQHGFVRFTPSGVIRPGFAMLAAECLARKRKRRAAAEAAVAAFLSAENPATPVRPFHPLDHTPVKRAS